MLMRNLTNMFSRFKATFWIIIAIAFVLILLSSVIIVKSLITIPYSSPLSKVNRSLTIIPIDKKNEATKSASKSAVLQKPKITLPSQINSGFGIPILTYHYVANNPNPNDRQRDALSVSPDKFDLQMSYLSKNGYTPISIDTLYAIFSHRVISPQKPVVLTFDDGYQDFYSIVFPILSKYNFHAVSFIPTGLMGGSYYMTWSQIKEIQASGLVTFEDHTISHANLASLSYDAALKQMSDSKNELFAQTSYPVNFIAYPYGITNTTVMLAAQKAGFAGGLGTWFSKATGPGFNMPRIKVSGYWSINEFAARL